MRYTVYHTVNFNDWLFNKDATLEIPKRPAMYVDAESLKEVFQLTNDMAIGHPKNVKLAVRSTSVGDVIVQGKRAYIVDTVGFVNFPNAPKWLFEE